MKIAYGFMVVLLLTFRCLANDGFILTFDQSLAQSKAVSAIRQKFPEVQTNDLSCWQWVASSTTNEPIMITITFALGSPKVTKENEKPDQTLTKFILKTIVVVMTAEGQIKTVSRGLSQSFHSLSNKKDQCQQTSGGDSSTNAFTGHGTP